MNISELGQKLGYNETYFQNYDGTMKKPILGNFRKETLPYGCNKPFDELAGFIPENQHNELIYKIDKYIKQNNKGKLKKRKLKKYESEESESEESESIKPEIIEEVKIYKKRKTYDLNNGVKSLTNQKAIKQFIKTIHLNSQKGIGPYLDQLKDYENKLQEKELANSKLLIEHDILKEKILDEQILTNQSHKMIHRLKKELSLFKNHCVCCNVNNK